MGFDGIRFPPTMAVIKKPLLQPLHECCRPVWNPAGENGPGLTATNLLAFSSFRKEPSAAGIGHLLMCTRSGRESKPVTGGREMKPLPKLTQEEQFELDMTNFDNRDKTLVVPPNNRQDALDLAKAQDRAREDEQEEEHE